MKDITPFILLNKIRILGRTHILELFHLLTLEDSKTREIRQPSTGVTAFQFSAISSSRLKVCDSLPPDQITFLDNEVEAFTND